MTIQEFNLTIKHRAGRKNQSADALSRNPAEVVIETNVNAVTVPKSCDGSVSESTTLSEKEHQRVDEIRWLQ